MASHAKAIEKTNIKAIVIYRNITTSSVVEVTGPMLKHGLELISL